jgi:copper chaperone CopZ
MDRRGFIQRISAAGTGSLAMVGISSAAEGKAVAFKVKGYSCVTCAIGLEVLLRQQKGVSRVKASYTDSNVAISFDPEVISERSIKNLIASMGFTVQEEETKR